MGDKKPRRDWATSWQAVRGTIRQHPSTVAVPAVLFAVIVALGVWLVVLAANAYASMLQHQTRTFAASYTQNLQTRLQQVLTPVYFLRSVAVQDATSAASLAATTGQPGFKAAAWQIMQGATEIGVQRNNTASSSSLAGLLLLPQGRLAIKIPANLSVEPLVVVDGMDVLDWAPALRAFALEAATLPQDGALLGGPSMTSDGRVVVYYLAPLWLPVPEDLLLANGSRPAYLPLDVPPASNCPACLEERNGTVFWGFVSSLGYFDAAASINELEPNYRFDLQAPNRAVTSPDSPWEGMVSVVASIGRPVVHPIIVEFPVDFSNRTWHLCLGPKSGTWYPVWKWPLVAVVVVAACIVALLQFLLMLSWRQNSGLLRSLLPQSVINRLRNQKTHILRPCAEKLPLGTPAEVLLDMLAKVMAGQQVDIQSAMMARTVLLQAHDIYLPMDLGHKLREALVDTDVAEALRRQFGAKSDDDDSLAARTTAVHAQDPLDFEVDGAGDSNIAGKFVSLQAALTALIMRGNTAKVTPAGTAGCASTSELDVVRSTAPNLVQARGADDPSTLWDTLATCNTATEAAHRTGSGKCNTNGANSNGTKRPAVLQGSDDATLRTSDFSPTLCVPTAVAQEEHAFMIESSCDHHREDKDPPKMHIRHTIVSQVSQAETLLASIGEWSFDAIALSAATQGHPLSSLAYYIFETTGLTHRFGIKRQALARFLCRVEALYPNNPYHCAAHAADVLQTTHVLFTRGMMSAFTDPLGQLACYFAAIIHDIGHPGRTNDFLCATLDELALQHNDRAPLENHHCSLGFSLLKRPGLDFLAPLSRADHATLRKMVIELVLGTDMKQHFAMVSQFKVVHKEAALPPVSSDRTSFVQLVQPSPAAKYLSVGSIFTSTKQTTSTTAVRGNSTLLMRGATTFGLQPELPQQTAAIAAQLDDCGRLITLQVMLKCADLGHLTAPLPVHLQWVSALENEFFLQGDAEKAIGLPVSPLFDRDKPGITKSQTGFIEWAVLPLFSALTEAVPSTGPLLAALQENYQYWQARQAEGM